MVIFCWYRKKDLIFFQPLELHICVPCWDDCFQGQFCRTGCKIICCSIDSCFRHLVWINTPKKQGALRKKIKSIHPSIVIRLSEVGSSLPPATLSGGSRDVPRPEGIYNPSRKWDNLPVGCARKTSKGRWSGSTNQMHEPPQQTLFDAEEQQLYSEFPPDGRASHPISMAEPSHPLKETHLSRLCPQSCSFVTTQISWS